MEIYEKARLAQLAARLRLNAVNGNVANTAAPGVSNRGAVNGGPDANGKSATAGTAKLVPLPPAFAKLTIDVGELLPHLSNARELYSARSAVSKNSNQLYGTMIDLLDDDDDISDYLMVDDAAVEEGDMELGGELLQAHEIDADPDAEADMSEDGAQVAGSTLDASA